MGKIIFTGSLATTDLPSFDAEGLHFMEYCYSSFIVSRHRCTYLQDFRESCRPISFFLTLYDRAIFLLFVLLFAMIFVLVYGLQIQVSV